MARRTSKTSGTATGGRKPADKVSGADAKATAKPTLDKAALDKAAIPDAEVVEPDAKAPSEPASDATKPEATPDQDGGNSPTKPDSPAAGKPAGSEAAAKSEKATPAPKAAGADKSPKAGAEDAKAPKSASPSPTAAASPSSKEPPAAPTPPPAAATAAPRKGIGVRTLAGSVAAAAILAYGASYFGLLPTPAPDPAPQTAALETALAQQAEALAALQGQIETLSQVEPAAPAPAPEIDFTPVTEQIGTIANRVDSTGATIESLVDRIAVLEDRPIFTGEVGDDAAEAAEALSTMETQLNAQRAEADRLAAELAALTQEAAAALAEAEAAQAAAEAAIAEAEAEAAAIVARAEGQAALNAVRVSLQDGTPFADSLSVIAPAAEIPEALSRVADAGVATLAELQAGFGPAARAALPVALRETAGDSTIARLGAFLQGQVGGRALEPREGEDPDAILSRVQGAVTTGDLDTALAELATLPAGAQAELASWAEAAQARAAALSAVATLTQALSGTN